MAATNENVDVREAQVSTQSRSYWYFLFLFMAVYWSISSQKRKVQVLYVLINSVVYRGSHCSFLASLSNPSV